MLEFEPSRLQTNPAQVWAAAELQVVTSRLLRTLMKVDRLVADSEVVDVAEETDP